VTLKRVVRYRCVFVGDVCAVCSRNLVDSIHK